MRKNSDENKKNIIEDRDANIKMPHNGSDLTTESSQRRNLTKTVAIMLAIALGSFAIGGFVGRLTVDKDLRALDRIKNRIDNDYYYSISDEEFYGVIYDAINGRLLDSYSMYMTADEFVTNTAASKGKRSGLGLVFTIKSVDGADQMYISRVAGNSPAEKAGVKAGSYVIGFGKTVDDIKESVIFDEFLTFVSERATGEPFVVKVRDGEKEATVSLSKEKYVENYVFYHTSTTAYRFQGDDAKDLTVGGDPFTYLDATTAYIRLTQFNGGAADEFKQAMDVFKEEGKINLVLDLRGNGGGYLDVMREISSYFCKTAKQKKPVVMVADYGEKRREFKATGNDFYRYFTDESRICVLADVMTASASECLIGAMIDYGAVNYTDICLAERGGIAKTFGKGIMQTTYPFYISGGAIKLTTAQIRWPVSDTCIHDRGILPEDGAVSMEEDRDWEKETKAAIEKLFS
ncbi:MAG: hypothetical protein E7366_00450 [Clostridiales bacterium]|nr:hypothetical protein [Clostridiales bacterium]